MVAPKEKPEITFEQALEMLEKLVERMEKGEVGLSELLEKYEEGSRLLRTCETRLKDAEMKIEKLRTTHDGVALEAFESEEA